MLTYYLSTVVMTSLVQSKRLLADHGGRETTKQKKIRSKIWVNLS